MKNVQVLSSKEMQNVNGGGPIARFVEWALHSMFCDDDCSHYEE